MNSFVSERLYMLLVQSKFLQVVFTFFIAVGFSQRVIKLLMSALAKDPFWLKPTFSIYSLPSAEADGNEALRTEKHTDNLVYKHYRKQRNRFMYGYSYLTL